VKTKGEEPDIIDLTQDENMDLETPYASKPPDVSDHMKANESATLDPTPHENSPRKAHVFAEDDANASLPELLDCLTHDELKHIGKQVKVTKTGQTVSTCAIILPIFKSRLIRYNSVQVYRRRLYPTLLTKQP
jgi:hypothetical protein